ncbi:DUF1810 domain-containing protein [Paracoccus benzoatiresistens]|uniref:DUF1810 domain-containing protein n=1 Tax=Paracoccus benzoatiresistens TaxID=2997341 RepID=A0ABT4J2V5_9RHOB|nr:DUF1810 domain-containing protein [Paracoccus sp. EF6]MCZ0960728.1 DUF1810 domain-containing protein [Paracoccus sp. EF6]
MARLDKETDTLDRFVAAQDGTHEVALSELRRGRKQSHWMWFIFPQLRGLGMSPMSHYYGIEDMDEARRYLAHPVLGPRLIACAEAILAHGNLPAETILGPVDAVKLCSSATLFAAVEGAPPVFERILDTFFDGHPCRFTAGKVLKK